MPLLPGESLNKRYRIVSLLGQGPYGVVYRAWDQTAKVDVAIKEYLDPSPEIQRLFRIEAGRLNNLKHPQLPQVRDHFCLEDSGQYLISEFIEGEDLKSLLDQYGPMPSHLIIDWLQSASDPLTYLHQKNQLHLNIKPANIRITPSGEVFLVDTGLPGLGVSVGTPGYASPEQQKQGSVNSASDIYGMGATLYSLLTGLVPPDALHRESGLEELIPARELNPDVEPYLSVAASRAMDIRPEVRYESAADFARSLDRPLGRTHVSPETPRRIPNNVAQGSRPRLAEPKRKRIEQRTIFGLAGLLILLVGISIGLFLASRTPAGEARQESATATVRSEIIAALTAISTPSPTPAASPTPLPTPEPLIDEITGAKMIFVPGGIFRMGSDDTDPDEAPSHVVKIDAFFIDETEVTNGQYLLCVEDGACEPPDRSGATFHPAYFGDSAYADFPVIFVNWFDARDFCAWRGARLPTEAEWEKAAGFDPIQAIKYTYPWGDLFDGTLLNFCDVNCSRDERNTEFDDGHRDTSEVGSFPGGRSPIGLDDMAGNVMEWVNDWYDSRAYSQSADTNPIGPLEGEFKTLRGGSWLSTEEDVRVTGRSSFNPTVSRANLGFRCAMTAQ